MCELDGVVHGLVVLLDASGERVAGGCLLQQTSDDGREVTSRLRIRFPDGSLHDETTVFEPQPQLPFVRARLTRSGPSFAAPLEARARAERDALVVTFRSGADACEATERLKRPERLMNGLPVPLLEQLTASGKREEAHLLAFTPRPRILKLAVASWDKKKFEIGDTDHEATHYVVRPELGGLAKHVAPLAGWRPPDVHAWIWRLGPAF